MVDDQQLAKARDILIAHGGGYLRNPIREHRVTCSVCTTPAPGYERCYACHLHYSAAPGRLADAVAPLTYAVAQTQSGYLMHGYKANPPVKEHVGVLVLLLYIGISLHSRCADVLAGAAVTHWATVPSLPRKPGTHPLRTILGGMNTWPEVKLIAAEQVQDPRTLSQHHFELDSPLPDGSHVLLFDDTWARGGHAQSAAMALRAAGAAHVSVMVAARWIAADWDDNREFLRRRTVLDFDVRICPWTGGQCP